MRLLALMLSLCLLIAPAFGQGSRPHPVDDAGPLGIPFGLRDLRTVTEELGFDADQKAAARALFDGYRASFMEATGKSNAVITAEEAKGEYQSPAKAAEVVRYVEGVRALEVRLMGDLKDLCTPAQAERFVSAERALRRRKGFRLALAAGEGIDLTEILRELKVDAAAVPGAAEVLSRWEVDVDRYMVEKDQSLRAGFAKMIADEGDQGQRVQKARQDFVGELMRLSGLVRDVNKKAARELEPLLPEPVQGAFRHAIEVRTFPRIFGPSRPEKVIDSGLRLADLSAEQKSALDELRAAYVKEAGPINTRLAAAALEMQAKMAEDMDGIMMSAEDAKLPFWGVQKERHELDARTVAKAQGILTADQWGRVKAPAEDSMPEFLPDVSAMEREMKEEFGQEEPAPDAEQPPAAHGKE
jgi:hypothetical protein